ncbi:MAG: sugar phosphate nucleotidyltransferase [Crocinitomicaceae bacterium]|nr:sugar phosphate nucleotidyltransferase [Crocinitomicaceae bacterium]MDG1735396.1 sugar phosphate nucleotidyltransferase [Crocinitomicaceae bacterium]
MNIIVPMAGRGSRLRPHTLTVPKPLIRVGGKPIVHRLVEDIAKMCSEKIDKIAFVIGDFGESVEQELLQVAETLGAKGSIHHQTEPLGTAHAVLCAKSCLEGPVIVAFADTLFKADFQISEQTEGMIWVKKIEDPSAFGVVQLDEKNVIIDFVEKPKEFISDLAMIGIYFFKNGSTLKTELNYLLDNDLQKGGEYQLPDALRRLTEKGTVFMPGQVDAWLDCGNKKVTVETNKHVLNFDQERGVNLRHSTAEVKNSIVIEPCFLGEGSRVENSVIGPHVSLGEGSKVENSILKNCLIQQNTFLENQVLKDSMIGSFASVSNKAKDLSVGDFTSIDDAL